jgi:hypothetical protein
MVEAAVLYSSLATGVDPVKVTFLTEGFSHISFATSLMFFCVVMMLITPSGMPALLPSCAVCVKRNIPVERKDQPTSANANAVKGVSAGGLITAVQPAARAGPNFRVIIADGKFQGVMMDLLLRL